VLDKNHAYTKLAAPIAALLFFFVLALGVLLGAEFNAAIEERKPAKIRPPRVLDPRNWQMFQPNADAGETDASTNGAPDNAKSADQAEGPANRSEP
jgi:membrane protein